MEKDFAPLFSEMPKQISDAIFGTTPAVELPIPNNTPEPFGYFAKVKPNPEQEEEIEFGAPHDIAKLAVPIPIATAALAGPTYIAPPRQFLGDDFDSDETEAARALEPIRRLFSEGVFRNDLTPTPSAPIAKRQLVTRETVAPATETEPLVKRDDEFTPELAGRITKVIMDAPEWADDESEEDYDARIARIIEPYL